MTTTDTPQGEMEALAPCPFCGSDDVHVVQHLNHTDVACFQCSASVNAHTWNRRALSRPPAAGMIRRAFADGFWAVNGASTSQELELALADLEEAWGTFVAENRLSILSASASVVEGFELAPKGWRDVVGDAAYGLACATDCDALGVSAEEALRLLIDKHFDRLHALECSAAPPPPVPAEGELAPVGWLDIDTAPKLHPIADPDGAFLLVGAPGKQTRQVWWEDEKHGWVTGYHHGHPITIGYQPTHWMPLPEPPASPSRPSGGKER